LELTTGVAGHGMLDVIVTLILSMLFNADDENTGLLVPAAIPFTVQ
jgi:hypothetical protein